MLFRLLHWLVRLVLLPFWAPVRAVRRRFRKGTWLYLEVDGAIVDFAPRRWFDAFSRRRTLSVHALGRVADLAIADPHVTGLLVILRGFGGGMATATGFRDVLLRLRAAGKQVAVHLPLGAGNKETFVAMAASRVLLGPQATLAPLGFASSTRYVKGALDKLGVSADVMARGAYKSAGESLSRDSMSEPQREQLSALLDEMVAALTGSIAAGRNVSEARAKELIDGAPYRARAAIDAGLVDAAAYEDELPALLGSPGAPASLIEATRYASARAARLMPRVLSRPVVAIVNVHGAIVGSGPPSLFGERAASDEHVIGAVRAARLLKRVRAVILHVDSPGGSALASDRMYHELCQLRREKPLVTCMANVAASGGYYVAAATHHIVAQPTTITGSIGVVSARIVAEPLLARLGIVTETLRRGAHAGLLDMGKTLEPGEREALDREIGGIYDAFIEAVAEGRGKPKDAIEAVAQGRVWSGRDAQARGLVDTLGGFETALQLACARAGLEVSDVQVGSIRAWSKIPPLPLPRDDRAPAAYGLVLRALGVQDLALLIASGADRVLAWSPIASRFLE